MSFNKITIVGNLGRDPELRYTPQGTAVANLSVATTEKRKDSDGEFQNVTTWFRCTLWGKQAENAAKYLTKGSPVYLEGRLRIEEWTDRDGNNRFTLEANCSDMQFLGGGSAGRQETADEETTGDEEQQEEAAPAPAKAKAAAAGKSAPAGKKAPPAKKAAAEEDDDIPF